MNEEVEDAIIKIPNIIFGQTRQKMESPGKAIYAAIPFSIDNSEVTIEVYFEEKQNIQGSIEYGL